jgi:ankyrin repeat protein
MSENMGPSFAEAIGKDREAFLELDSTGLNSLHSLALGGSAACVRILLEAGMDHRAKTRSGKTALELATMMEWPRVVELLRGAETKS